MIEPKKEFIKTVFIVMFLNAYFICALVVLLLLQQSNVFFHCLTALMFILNFLV